jgi:hypothetical protein
MAGRVDRGAATVIWDIARLSLIDTGVEDL